MHSYAREKDKICKKKQLLKVTSHDPKDYSRVL